MDKININGKEYCLATQAGGAKGDRAHSFLEVGKN